MKRLIAIASLALALVACGATGDPTATEPSTHGPFGTLYTYDNGLAIVATVEGRSVSSHQELECVRFRIEITNDSVDELSMFGVHTTASYGREGFSAEAIFDIDPESECNTETPGGVVIPGGTRTHFVAFAIPADETRFHLTVSPALGAQKVTFIAE